MRTDITTSTSATVFSTPTTLRTRGRTPSTDGAVKTHTVSNTTTTTTRSDPTSSVSHLSSQNGITLELTTGQNKSPGIVLLLTRRLEELVNVYL